MKQANYSVFHRPAGKINADSALEFLWQIDEDNCKNYKRDAEELNLKGDISWGAEKQFENEALMAVRTANFISAFLQVGMGSVFLLRTLMKPKNRFFGGK